MHLLGACPGLLMAYSSASCCPEESSELTSPDSVGPSTSRSSLFFAHASTAWSASEPTPVKADTKPIKFSILKISPTC